MKVAQVSPFLPSRSGGSVVYCKNLATHLEQRGHDVEIISSSFPRYDTRRMMGQKIRIAASRCYGLALGVNPISFVLPNLMRSEADVVHAHSYIFFTSNQAAAAARLRRRPFVLHIHGATYVRQPMLDKRTSLALLLKEKLYDKTLGKWTIECADAIAAVSKFDLRQCQEVFDVDKSKLHLIPNAVDTSEFHPPRNNGHSGHAVTYVGRLEPWKGAQSLLRIAEIVNQSVPDARFNVVGGGSMEGQIVAKSAHLKGNIRFFGEVGHEEIAPILRASSVLVLPSYIEGLPTVCLEALACGVPVVASNVGGTSEVVIDGTTGYLCPVDDVDVFAERIIKLLQNDELRKQFGDAGRRLVESQYSWTQIAERTEHLYNSLV